jgi:hypothetical protein
LLSSLHQAEAFRNILKRQVYIMRAILSFLFSFFRRLRKTNNSNKTSNQAIELFNTFDKENHLQPLFDRSQFDTLHSWDFGYAILEPINIAKSKEDEKLLSKRFSPGQKALYFIWYLDAQVTNGGFIQFYWNGYAMYLPPIINGLKLIGDMAMVDLISKADKEFTTHKKEFLKQKQKDDWEPLYSSLKKFDEFDSIYYATHDRMMTLIEEYARQHPKEFVRFR